MEIVCLPVSDSDGRDVHIGWAKAALSQRDGEWARALLKGGVMVDEPEALADLLSVLPGGERDAAAADLIRWVRGGPICCGSWNGSPGRGRAAGGGGGHDADRVRRTSHAARRPPDQPAVLTADERLDPSAASRLDLGDAAPRAVTELIATLSFRDEMLKELTS